MSPIILTSLCYLKSTYPCESMPGLPLVPLFLQLPRLEGLPIPAFHFILSLSFFFFYYANLCRPGLEPCLLCEPFSDFLLQLIFLLFCAHRLFCSFFFPSGTHITLNYKLVFFIISLQRFICLRYKLGLNCFYILLPALPLTCGKYSS